MVLVKIIEEISEIEEAKPARAIILNSIYIWLILDCTCQ